MSCIAAGNVAIKQHKLGLQGGTDTHLTQHTHGVFEEAGCVDEVYSVCVFGNVISVCAVCVCRQWLRGRVYMSTDEATFCTRVPVIHQPWTELFYVCVYTQ